MAILSNCHFPDDSVLEKLGWKDFTFEFPEVDERKQEAALVRASKLKELGYSLSAIHKTILDAGIDIDEDFVENPENVSVTKNINDMPSRQARPKEGIPQNEAQRQQDIQNGTKKSSQ